MAEPDLAVNIGPLRLNVPVLVASGTFASGRQYSKFIDLGRLGAITVKGVSLKPWRGNPPPRIVETPAGMLNAIGLENPGVEHFLAADLPWLREIGVPVIVNIAGHSIDEYARLAEILDRARGVAALEVNISCPNVAEGGLAFGVDPELTRRVIRAVCENTSLLVIAKLSPNVTSIVDIALAAADAGAGALSLINTLLGMAIDIERRRPVLGNARGGLSGPAIRPVAVRMVWEVSRAVNLPVIGMGGIITAADALEFILAGAAAVAVGTANFINPRATVDIIDGLRAYLVERGIPGIGSLVGAAWGKPGSLGPA